MSCMKARWFQEGHWNVSWVRRAGQAAEGAHLQQVVLDDVSDDSELVKVAAAALRTKGLLHDDLDVVDVLPRPHRRQEEVAEAHDEHVLHICHLVDMRDSIHGQHNVAIVQTCSGADC